MKRKIFFKAEQKIIGQTIDNVNILGYKLGIEEHIIKSDQVINLQINELNHSVLYLTDSKTVIAKAKDWNEFLGYGYIDMSMRVSQGLSKSTLKDIEAVTGAHWTIDGEEYFGNVLDWKAAGSPKDVWFGRFRDIMGVDLQ